MLRALWKGKLGHRLKDRNKKLESAAVWEVSTVVCYLRLVCFDVLSALVTQFTKYVRIRVSRQEKTSGVFNDTKSDSYVSLFLRRPARHVMKSSSKMPSA
jgi:hypothetical protein